MKLAVALAATAMLTCTTPTHSADAAPPAPLQVKKVEKKRTAKLRSLRYDAKGRAYVLRASIALRILDRPASERAKTTLKAKLAYEAGGAPRTAEASSKLTNVKVVSKDAEQGIAVVELRIIGRKADSQADMRTSVELVGANPTPHP